MKILTSLLLLTATTFLSPLLYSQELKVIGDTEVLSKSHSFTIKAPVVADLYFWSVPKDVQSTEQFDTLIVTNCPDGRFIFSVTTITIELKVDWDSKEVTKEVIKKFYSVPVNVNNYGPKPEPDIKPEPEPKPQPAPIQAEGLHVLIVFESKEKNLLSKEHFNIIYTLPFREYLDKVCSTDSNATAAYRIWDKDENTEYVEKKWQDAMSRKRDSIPWLIVSNPTKGGYEGPLPNSLEETKAIIERLK